jgi:disulfide bond formation protein DsbB
MSPAWFRLGAGAYLIASGSTALRDRPTLLPLAIVLVCASALAAALAAQYWGGLLPCELCMRQRYAYLGAGALGLVALGWAVADRRRASAAFVGLAALAFAIGAAIAAFHVGVEQHWWQGTSSCGGALFQPGASIQDLTKAIEGAPMVRCDQIAWSFLGISMAGYNVLASGFFALAAALGARRLWRAAASEAGGRRIFVRPSHD